MSKDHPVVFSFGGAEHHLTLAEAGSALGRLQAAIGAAMAAQERDTRATRALLDAKAREGAPPVDRSRRCTVGEAVAPGVPNTEDPFGRNPLPAHQHARMSAFSVGDLVGQTRVDPALDPPGFTYQRYLRQEVQIEITSVQTDSITTKVTVLGDFFSARRLDSAHDQGFVLGETLTLRRGGGEDSWVVDKPPNRPWHVLSCRDGKKTFEHYR